MAKKAQSNLDNIPRNKTSIPSSVEPDSSPLPAADAPIIMFEREKVLSLIIDTT